MIQFLPVKCGDIDSLLFANSNEIFVINTHAADIQIREALNSLNSLESEIGSVQGLPWMAADAITRYFRVAGAWKHPLLNRVS